MLGFSRLAAQIIFVEEISRRSLQTPDAAHYFRREQNGKDSRL